MADEAAVGARHGTLGPYFKGENKLSPPIFQVRLMNGLDEMYMTCPRKAERKTSHHIGSARQFGRLPHPQL